MSDSLFDPAPYVDTSKPRRIIPKELRGLVAAGLMTFDRERGYTLVRAKEEP